MSIKSVMPSNHLILCHPPLLLPSIFSSIRVFSYESALPIRWPEYASFSFSISPSNEYSRLTYFSIDWFDLAIQGTLKSFLHFKSISSLALSLLYGRALTSIHDYWENHSFGYMDFHCKMIILLFNMLSRLVIAFLSRSKHLLISWLQSPSLLIFGAQENKV